MSAITQYVVEPHGGQWRVSVMGDRAAAYAYGTKDDAIRDALNMARHADGDRQVLVPTDDGRGNSSLWASWKDSFPPPTW